jgi:tetratricopeptide (TPR) repeat protein
MNEWLKGNNREAIKLLKDACKLNPNNSNAWNIIGTIYVVNNQTDEAIDAFQHSVEISRSPEDYFNLFNVLKGANKEDMILQYREQGIAVFDQLLNRDPKNINGRLLYALILAWSNKKDQAELEAEKIIREPLDGNTLYNLGVLYDHLGRPELRIQLFKEAIKNGYREIEQTRTHSLETKSTEREREFRALVSELELIVKTESGIS